MHKDPLISIIIPIYNTEKYLNRCLDSITKQTYHNLEIILIDDGSTDKSGFICDEWKKRDNRIVIIHKKHNGQSVARNIALDIFKGDYVSFIDSDDYVSLNFIEFLYKLIINNNADFSACSCSDIYKNKIIKTYLNDSILTGNYVYKIPLFWNRSTNKLFKRKLILNLRFPENINYFEDAIFVRCLCLKVNRVVTSSNICYFYEKNPNSIIQSKKPSFYECKLLTKIGYDYLLMVSKKDGEKDIKNYSLYFYLYWFNNMINFKNTSRIGEINFEYKILWKILKICKSYKHYFYYKIHFIYNKLKRFLVK